MKTRALISTVQQWFEEKASSFLTEHQKEHEIVQPRVDHIRKVALLCRSLAEELQWDKDDIAAGEIIGYLHDIGRFSQYSEFHTFIDAYSVNHTKRSLAIVVTSGILQKISEHYRIIITEGIRYHNTRKFKKHVHTESVPFLRLIRDADKLEKYIRLAEDFDIGSHSQKSLTIEHDGPVNPAAIEYILKERKIPKKHIHTQLDYHLLQLSWIFEVTYPHTIRRIKESDVINGILHLLPDDPDINKAVKRVSEYLDSFD